MKRNRIGRIVIHNAAKCDFNALSDQISAKHAEVIERKLNALPLTPQQKITVLDRIMQTLQERENDGGIR